MFKHVYLFLILTVTYVHVTSASLLGPKDHARKLLDKLRKSTNEARIEALNILHNIEEQTEEVTRKISLDSRQTIEEKTKLVVTEVKQLKNYAINHKIDITDCVDTYEIRLVNLPDSIKQQIHDCLISKRQTINDVLNIASGKIQKLYEKTNELEDELEQCGNGFKSIFCIGKVTIKITYQRLHLPKSIKKQAKNVEKRTDQLYAALRLCSQEKIQQGITEAKDVLAVYSKCVHNKVL